MLRNCLYSGATPDKLIIEAVLPAIKNIEKLYLDGKIGTSEKQFLENTITKSLEILYQQHVDSNPKKNSIVISADSENNLISNAASAYLHSNGWKVFHLGDMSSAINVLFDLDLQKLLRKVWKQKSGIMVIVVFSNSEEGLNFFADATNSLKDKMGKNFRLVLCGKIDKKTKIDSDYASEKFEDVMHWSESTYEGSEI